MEKMKKKWKRDETYEKDGKELEKEIKNETRKWKKKMYV